MQNIKNQQNFFSWSAPEFTRYEKSSWWFFWLILISALLILAALLMKNYLFVLIIALASFLIYVQALKHPRKIKFEISEKGILIDEKEHGFDEMKSFWIFKDSEPTLSILTKKITHPHLSIPLRDQDPEEIRNFLIELVPEERQEETLTDIVARKIKF